jgi:hypothetical protein
MLVMVGGECLPGVRLRAATTAASGRGDLVESSRPYREAFGGAQTDDDICWDNLS